MMNIISYSRKIIWLRASPTNNDPQIIAVHVLTAVLKYGGNINTMYIAMYMY